MNGGRPCRRSFEKPGRGKDDRPIPVSRDALGGLERRIGEGRIGHVDAAHVLVPIRAATLAYADFTPRMQRCPAGRRSR